MSSSTHIHTHGHTHAHRYTKHTHTSCYRIFSLGTPCSSAHTYLGQKPAKVLNVSMGATSNP